MRRALNVDSIAHGCRPLWDRYLVRKPPACCRDRTIRPAEPRGRDRFPCATRERSARLGVARTGTAVLALVASVAVGGCGSGSDHANLGNPSDPPLLVPWSRIGNIALGESRARVEREYGSEGHGYHVLQRSGNAVQGLLPASPQRSDRHVLREPRRRARLLDPVLPDESWIWRGEPDPAGPVSQDHGRPVRAPLARLRPQCVVERFSVPLLGEGRPRRAITSCDDRQLPEAVVLHLHPSWSCDSFLLRVEVHRLTPRLQALRPAASVWNLENRASALALSHRVS